MATKIPAAQDRLFKNVFFCKRCTQKIRVEPLKIMSGKVSCRKCGGKAFRAPRKK